MRKKKGISPLIATILLVGIVIVIAIIVWLWYNDVLTEYTQKTAEKSAAELACAQEVEIKVGGVNCIGGNGVVFDIENTGSTHVDSFKLRLMDTNDDFIKVKDLAVVLPTANVEQVGFEKDLEGITETIGSMEVIPMVVRSGKSADCLEKAILTEITC